MNINAKNKLQFEDVKKVKDPMKKREDDIYRTVDPLLGQAPKLNQPSLHQRRLKGEKSIDQW